MPLVSFHFLMNACVRVRLDAIAGGKASLSPPAPTPTDPKRGGCICKLAGALHTCCAAVHNFTPHVVLVDSAGGNFVKITTSIAETGNARTALQRKNKEKNNKNNNKPPLPSPAKKEKETNRCDQAHLLSA